MSPFCTTGCSSFAVQVGNVLGQQMKFVQGVPNMAKINESPELRHVFGHLIFIVWSDSPANGWSGNRMSEESSQFLNQQHANTTLSSSARYWFNIVQYRPMHGLWSGYDYDSVLTVKMITTEMAWGLYHCISPAWIQQAWNVEHCAFHGAAKRWWNQNESDVFLPLSPTKAYCNSCLKNPWGAPW